MPPQDFASGRNPCGIQEILELSDWFKANKLSLNIQKRIVRIISKKGFDANTNPLFNSLMILKLEHVYSLHLGSSPLASLSCENIMI